MNRTPKIKGALNKAFVITQIRTMEGKLFLGLWFGGWKIPSQESWETSNTPEKGSLCFQIMSTDLWAQKGLGPWPNSSERKKWEKNGQAFSHILSQIGEQGSFTSLNTTT